MTNDRGGEHSDQRAPSRPTDRREEPNPYDPGEFHTPPEGEPATRTVHEHRRRYDSGLMPPPVGSRWSGKVVLAIVATAAVSFLGAFWTIGNASHSACEQRQELAAALVVAVRRGEPLQRDLYQSGTITKKQLEEIIASNNALLKDLNFPPC